MCGIFGITKKTEFQEMDVSGSTLLCHRGPDNEGNWLQDADETVRKFSKFDSNQNGLIPLILRPIEMKN